MTFPIRNNYPEGIAKFKNAFWYLIRATMWCLASFLVVEITLRIVFYNPPFYLNSTNWAGDVPGPQSVMLWGKEGYGITHYEKWGEIQTPHDDNNKENDVIILGDSQTEALQVMDDVKFASFAETLLRQDGNDLDLHNLGRSGLAMADYISWIPGYRRLYDPKLIVVQLTDGDFIESFHLDQFNYFIEGDNELVDLVQTFDLSKRFNQRTRKKYYLDHFNILDLGSQRWSVLQPALSYSGDADEAVETIVTSGEFSSELVNQQMEMLLEVTEDVPLIIILLPSMPSVSGNEIETGDPDHERLKELIEQYPEVTLVDPLPQFELLASTGHLPRGFFNTLPGVGHLNKYGHEIVGQLLADAIRKTLE